jgi:hypothetical protein
VRAEPRVVVGRRRPIGTRGRRIELSATTEAVALGHLATHVDDLAISGELQKDSANPEAATATAAEEWIKMAMWGNGDLG